MPCTSIVVRNSKIQSTSYKAKLVIRFFLLFGQFSTGCSSYLGFLSFGWERRVPLEIGVNPSTATVSFSGKRRALALKLQTAITSISSPMLVKSVSLHTMMRPGRSNYGWVSNRRASDSAPSLIRGELRRWLRTVGARLYDICHILHCMQYMCVSAL